MDFHTIMGELHINYMEIGFKLPCYTTIQMIIIWIVFPLVVMEVLYIQVWKE
jgi:hypothetical protein